MQESIIVVCGREFSPAVLQHLRQVSQQRPTPSRNHLAREACLALAWYQSDGRLAVSSAKVALRKLHKRGRLTLPGGDRSHRSHRLRPSGQPLPPLARGPRPGEQIPGLRLHLVSGAADPLHGTWNDLMITHHPLGDAPLVGPQARYLIGSELGWLGALGFSPAAFVLGCRDQWIGWSTAARLAHLPQVISLSRMLLRPEAHRVNRMSQVLSLALARVAEDWEQRYGVRPVLVETFVDRSRFSGLSLAAANWQRIGASCGRGRLGPKVPTQTVKDVWVYPLDQEARPHLQQESPPPLTPCPLDQSLAQSDWWERELAGLDLGDVRRTQRAMAILQARWEQPQASFYGSFTGWTPTKCAYDFIEHQSPDLNLSSLLAAHQERTLARMAAEPWVLLPQDTTTLNFTGLKCTTDLGPLGEDKGQGLWLHSLLAFRPDGVPLGVVHVDCWARPQPGEVPAAGRNALTVEEKESGRWVEALHQAAQIALRMPQTQLVEIMDREGDLYEIHDQAQVAPSNLHVLVRAQHDRVLADQQKLWATLAAQPVEQVRELRLPRAHGQPARTAVVEVRWARVTITAPAVGHKKSWPPLSLSAVWVQESNPPAGVEPLDWMLLTDLPVDSAEAAWEKVQWYCKRWGIEEWHRALKTGCGAEQREFKTAEHLKRVLAFDLMVAWRVLACVKLGRALPQLPATVLYTPQELEVLLAAVKKKDPPLRR
jgi:hypothetical protein